MFVDRVRIKLKAGNGGGGKVAFAHNRMPAGGTGGDGGDVYLEGSNSLQDLSGIKPTAIYAADDGGYGGNDNLSGKTGQDLVLRVPVKTHVYNKYRKRVLTIDKAGERKLFSTGGRGGLGNWYYRGKGLHNSHMFQSGKPGDLESVTLELELQSDIIFIGLPNAGKSSILNTFTNADAKVADYAFTTLNPDLGRMGEIVLMDLPDLIEHTAEGKGLGTSFVKHTKSARLVAHFVSLEAADPVADYELIRKELIAIDQKLADKPEIIILTKTDLIPSAEIAEKIKLFTKFNRPTLAISVYDMEATEKLKQEFEQFIADNPVVEAAEEDAEIESELEAETDESDASEDEIVAEEIAEEAEEL